MAEFIPEFFDGTGAVLDREYVMKEFDNYVTFADAAKMINPAWTTHYLHKQKAIGRINMKEILFVVDRQQAYFKPSTGGKKMFIHKREIERFKREVYPNIRKQRRNTIEEICMFCRVKIKECFQEPCRERREALLVANAKLSPNFALSLPISRRKKK